MINMNQINQDIELFKSNFPNITFDFNSIKWLQAEDLSKEWLKNVKSKKSNNFYFPWDRIIVLDETGIENDYVRYHELGHAIHHNLLDYKRYVFSSEYKDLIPLYWGIGTYEDFDKKGHEESFASVFSDMMLRYKHPNAILLKCNTKMIKILSEVR